MARNDRRGLTLVELLVVAVIIGILAAIAIPRLSTTKDKAKLAAVKSDLHALQVSQEAHLAAYGTYGTLAQLTTRTRLTLSAGNTAAAAATTSGYTVTVTNASISTGFKKCQVTVGRGSAPTVDGKFICS